MAKRRTAWTLGEFMSECSLTTRSTYETLVSRLQKELPNWERSSGGHGTQIATWELAFNHNGQRVFPFGLWADGRIEFRIGPQKGGRSDHTVAEVEPFRSKEVALSRFRSEVSEVAGRSVDRYGFFDSALVGTEEGLTSFIRTCKQLEEAVKGVVVERKLTGKIARERIRMLETPDLPEGVIEGFQALGDASGIVSDVMDELGITGVIAASTLRPTMPGAVIVGRALTVRNIPQRAHPYEAAKAHANGMAEFEAHNLARPGDVVVIAGVAGVSNMGGISSQTGKRSGEAGAIVWGGVRDVAHSRGVGYPMWSTEVTPVTGKWRIQTVEINGDIEIGGVRVSPGDLVLADDTGVCFVPASRALEVLELARAKSDAEDAKCAAIDAGVPVPDLPGNA